MKIVFVEPVGTGVPPMGLMYLVAMLKKNGFTDVELISLTKDNVSKRRSMDYLLEKLKEKPIVGITSMTPLWTEAVKIAGLAKENGCKVLVGGPGPSIWKEKLLEKYPFIDFVVFGEGEQVITPLIKAIQEDKEPKDIPGVIYRNETGKIIVGPANPLIKDLDSLPFADRDCIDLKTFHGPFSVLASRGCPYNCAFCFKPVHGTVFRPRSPKNVADEMEWLLKTYPGIAKEFDYRIVIADDIFNLDMKRAKDIADEMVRRKLNCKLVFVNGLHVKHVDLELMQKLKAAGTVELWFACDAGSEKVLANLGKGITLDMVRNAVKLARQAGIPKIGMHFVIGLENETLETAREAIAFAKSLNLDEIGFNHANVLPGTRLWDYALKHGKLLFETDGFDFSAFKQQGFPFFETPEFPKEDRIKVFNEAIELMDSVRRKHTLRPSNVLKFISTLKSPADVLWALDRARTFFFSKHLRLQKKKPQPSKLTEFNKASPAEAGSAGE